MPTYFHLCLHSLGTQNVFKTHITFIMIFPSTQNMQRQVSLLVIFTFYFGDKRFRVGTNKEEGNCFKHLIQWIKLDENYITKYLSTYVENTQMAHTQNDVYKVKVLRSQCIAEPVQDLWPHQFLHGCKESKYLITSAIGSLWTHVYYTVHISGQTHT